MKKSLSRTVASLSVARHSCSARRPRREPVSVGRTTARVRTRPRPPRPSGPWKAYRQALATYVAARKTIADNFRNAVQSAKATYEAALASATTGAERSTARAAYSLAIAQAAAARSSALISLGNPPVRPNLVRSTPRRRVSLTRARRLSLSRPFRRRRRRLRRIRDDRPLVSRVHGRRPEWLASHRGCSRSENTVVRHGYRERPRHRGHRQRPR